MAQLIFDYNGTQTVLAQFNDLLVPRVLNAVIASGGYPPKDVDGNPLPITKAQFAKQMLMAYLKSTTVLYEQTVASTSAGLTAQQQADADIQIT